MTVSHIFSAPPTRDAIVRRRGEKFRMSSSSSPPPFSLPLSFSLSPPPLSLSLFLSFSELPSSFFHPPLRNVGSAVYLSTVHEEKLFFLLLPLLLSGLGGITSLRAVRENALTCSLKVLVSSSCCGFAEEEEEEEGKRDFCSLSLSLAFDISLRCLREADA